MALLSHLSFGNNDWLIIRLIITQSRKIILTIIILGCSLPGVMRTVSKE